MKRTISIIVLLALGTPFVLLAPPRLFAVLVATISCLSLQEYLSLMLDDFPYKKIYFWWGMGVGAAVSLSLVIFDGNPEALLGSFVFSILVLSAVDLIIRRNITPTFMPMLSVIVLGLVYSVMTLSFTTLVRYLPNGRNALIDLSLITLIRDLASNISGRLLKTGYPIAPAINPKKTLQGAFCGFILTLGTMIAFQNVFPQFSLNITIIKLILLVAVLSLGGQFGDLVESFIKRMASVKDSSNLIPGQGGILDSFDSFVFNSPLIYYFIILSTIR